MAENEKKIIATIAQALPKMTEREKERLLSFSEGMAYMAMNASTQPAPLPQPQEPAHRDSA